MKKRLMAILISFAMLCGAALPAWAESAVKDETVYILAAPNGEVQKIIVSDWLSNPEGADELADVSNLTDIENVKGEQPFENGVWQADGQDIYYQGESEEPLPVDLKITYWLDGQEIAPEELAGRDGHVTIRFDYKASRTETVTVNDRQEAISVPYAAVTGALLENNVFTNITAVNACIVNDGDRTLVVGMALPGVQSGLNIDAEVFEFPEYVEIEADVKTFSLPVTVTVATSEIFAQLDVERLNDAEGLKEAITGLADGMAQLLDGSTQLYDGLTNLAEGTDLLAEGIGTLSDGLAALIANNESLTSASEQVFNTLLAMANQQLADAGAEVAELTIENYAEILSALTESMSEEGIAQQARAQVEQVVRAQDKEVREAVEAAVRAEIEVQAEPAVRENVLSQVLVSVNMTAEEYDAARENGQLSTEQIEQIEGAVDQQMVSDEVKALVSQQIDERLASEEVQATIDQKTEEQIQALIDQQMSGDDVQQQIQQSLAQYQATCDSLTALKEQLDGYNAFYTGLIAYTEGVSSAASGAEKLVDSMPALQEGMAQLQEGALAMKEGMAGFSLDGVDLDALLTRARALIDAAQSAQNYSGMAEDMIGTTRFIWRTDAIEP